MIISDHYEKFDQYPDGQRPGDGVNWKNLSSAIVDSYCVWDVTYGTMEDAYGQASEDSRYLYCDTTSSANLLLGNIDVGTMLNVTVSARQKLHLPSWADRDDHVGEICLRIQSEGNFYGCTLDPVSNQLLIWKCVGGTYTLLAEDTGATISGDLHDRWLHIKFEIQGNELRAMAWSAGAATPSTWQVTVVDDTFATDGLVGYHKGDHHFIATYLDHYYVYPVDAGAAYTEYYNDRVTGEVTQGFPAGFTERWGASGGWSVVEGTGELREGVLRHTNGTAAHRLLSWDALDSDPLRDDVELLTLFKTGGSEEVRLYARASGAASNETAYLGIVDGTTLSLEKLQGGTPSVITSTLVPTVHDGNWWFMRFRVWKSNLYLKLWQLGQAEPAWHLQTTNTDIAGAGWAGLGSYDIATTDFAYLSAATQGGEAPTPIGSGDMYTSQLPLEALTQTTDPETRVSQTPMEALVTQSSPTVGVSQLPLEVLWLPANNARVTQLYTETMWAPTAAASDARVTYQGAEVAFKPYGKAQVTGMYVEVMTSVYDAMHGDGSAVSPYIIRTAAQLNAVRFDLSAHYVLGNDIDLSPYPNWDPIDDFTGVLDGQGFRVTELVINRPGRHLGLFGTMETGTITHMAVITGAAGITGSASHYKGVILGYGMDNPAWSITNCYAQGLINTGGDRAGGLVGAGDSAANSGTGANLSLCWAAVQMNGIGTLVGPSVGFADETYLNIVGTVGDRTVAGTTNRIGIEKTTTQMYKQATFTGGWDFDEIWQIEADVDYPRFRKIGYGDGTNQPMLFLGV